MNGQGGNAASAGHVSLAARLGIAAGATVQMIGLDDDSDEQLAASAEALGATIVDEDYPDVVDMVVLWFREDDGDLADALLDSRTLLADGGLVWLLTPRPGRPGHLDGEDVAEAVPIAGLAATGTVSIGGSWQATRLAPPRRKETAARR